MAVYAGLSCPDDLRDALLKRECLLLYGGDILRQFGLSSEASWPDPFVGSLAAATGFPAADRRDLFEVFEWAARKSGLNYLNKRIADTYGQNAWFSSSPALQALGATRQRLSLTLWFDDAIKQITEAARGGSVTPIIRDFDARYIDDGKHEYLIYLLGRASDPASLITDTSEFLSRLDSHKLLSRMLSGHLATSTLFFLGFNWSHTFDFEDFYRHFVTLPPDRHSRRSYLLCDSLPDEAKFERLLARDLHVLRVDDPPTFILELASDVLRNQKPAASARRSIPTRKSETPYRYLSPYSREHNYLFFGRERVAVQVIQQIHGHRFLLVFGASGVGKTSLLEAGVAHELEARGFRFCCTRVLPTPREAILKALKTNSVGGDEPGRWLDVVELYVEVNHIPQIVVVFDQLEELFSDVSETVRGQFWKDVGACRLRSDNRIRVVFSIRQDALYLFQAAYPELPSPLAFTFYVDGLQADDREAVIREPASLYGRPWDQDFVDRVLSDVASVRAETAHLSVVLTTLWEKRTPGVGDLDLYESLGGFVGTLEKYLWQAIDNLPRNADAMQVMKAFVSPERRKVQLSVDDIAAEVGQGSGSLSATDVRDLCRNLVDARLLRAVDAARETYELAHDILAAALAKHITDAEMGRKVARRAIREAQQEYRATARLPSRDIFASLKRAATIAPCTLDDVVFMGVIAVSHGEPLQPWLDDVLRLGSSALALYDAILESGSLLGLHEVLLRIEENPIEDLLRLLPAIAADRRLSIQLHVADVLKELSDSTVRLGLELNKLPPEVTVAAGEFQMGYPSDQDGAIPPHQVTVDEFAIDRFPVTCRAYARFIAQTGHPAPSDWTDRRPPRGREYHPVTNVTWHDAMAYARWLGKRLPTEAEWEKAAYWDPNAERKRAYPWGDTFLEGAANYFGSGLGSTSPVGAFSPIGDSPYGVADIVGNTFEWCLDDAVHPFESFSSTINPCHVGRPKSPKMTRGGSYGGPAHQLGCSYRDYLWPASRGEVYIGFRCVRSAVDPIANERDQPDSGAAAATIQS